MRNEASYSSNSQELLKNDHHLVRSEALSSPPHGSPMLTPISQPASHSHTLRTRISASSQRGFKLGANSKDLPGSCNAQSPLDNANAVAIQNNGLCQVKVSSISAVATEVSNSFSRRNGSFSSGGRSLQTHRRSHNQTPGHESKPTGVTRPSSPAIAPAGLNASVSLPESRRVSDSEAISTSLSEHFDDEDANEPVLWDCPLCMEEVDPQDAEFVPCECGYQICRFCWHHIKSVLNDKCPACRRSYAEQEPHLTTLQPKKIIPRLTKRRDIKSPALLAASSSPAEPGSTVAHFVTTTRGGVPLGNVLASRKHLVDLRVLQPNLVYVIGIPINLSCYSSSSIKGFPHSASGSSSASSSSSSSSLAGLLEQILSSAEYFGRFGHLLKVVINLKGQHVTRNAASLNSCPTISAFLTYERREEASLAIESIDGTCILDYPLRASYGTTKYCAFFLRGQTCPNLVNCLYLHELGEDVNSYTKEALSARQHDSKLKRTLDNGTEVITHSLNNPPINARRIISEKDGLQSGDKLIPSMPYANILISPSCSSPLPFSVSSQNKPPVDCPLKTSSNTIIELPHPLKPSLFPLDEPNNVHTNSSIDSSKLIGSGAKGILSMPMTAPQVFDPLDPSNDIVVFASSAKISPSSPSPAFDSHPPITKQNIPFSRSCSRFEFGRNDQDGVDGHLSLRAVSLDPAFSEPSETLKRFQDLSITTILDQHVNNATLSTSQVRKHVSTVLESPVKPIDQSLYENNSKLVAGFLKELFPNVNISSTGMASAVSGPIIDEMGQDSKTSNRNSSTTKTRLVPGYEPIVKKKSSNPGDSVTLQGTCVSEITTTKAANGSFGHYSPIDSEDLSKQLQQFEYFAQLKESSKKGCKVNGLDDLSRPNPPLLPNGGAPSKTPKKTKKLAKDLPVIAVESYPKKTAVSSLPIPVKDDNIFAALLDEDISHPEGSSKVVDFDLFLKPAYRKRKKKPVCDLDDNQLNQQPSNVTVDLSLSTSVPENVVASDPCLVYERSSSNKTKKKGKKPTKASSNASSSATQSPLPHDCSAPVGRKAAQLDKKCAFSCPMRFETENETEPCLNEDADASCCSSSLSESYNYGTVGFCDGDDKRSKYHMKECCSGPISEESLFFSAETSPPPCICDYNNLYVKIARDDRSAKFVPCEAHSCDFQSTRKVATLNRENLMQSLDSHAILAMQDRKR